MSPSSPSIVPGGDASSSKFVCTRSPLAQEGIPEEVHTVLSRLGDLMLDEVISLCIKAKDAKFSEMVLTHSQEVQGKKHCLFTKEGTKRLEEALRKQDRNKLAKSLGRAMENLRSEMKKTVVSLSPSRKVDVSLPLSWQSWEDVCRHSPVDFTRKGEDVENFLKSEVGLSPVRLKNLFLEAMKGVIMGCVALQVVRHLEASFTYLGGADSLEKARGRIDGIQRKMDQLKGLSAGGESSDVCIRLTTYEAEICEWVADELDLQARDFREFFAQNGLNHIEQEMYRMAEVLRGCGSVSIAKSGGRGSRGESVNRGRDVLRGAGQLFAGDTWKEMCGAFQTIFSPRFRSEWGDFDGCKKNLETQVGEVQEWLGQMQTYCQHRGRIKKVLELLENTGRIRSRDAALYQQTCTVQAFLDEAKYAWLSGTECFPVPALCSSSPGAEAVAVKSLKELFNECIAGVKEFCEGSLKCQNGFEFMKNFLFRESIVEAMATSFPPGPLTGAQKEVSGAEELRTLFASVGPDAESDEYCMAGCQDIIKLELRTVVEAEVKYHLSEECMEKLSDVVRYGKIGERVIEQADCHGQLPPALLKGGFPGGKQRKTQQGGNVWEWFRTMSVEREGSLAWVHVVTLAWELVSEWNDMGECIESMNEMCRLLSGLSCMGCGTIHPPVESTDKRGALQRALERMSARFKGDFLLTSRQEIAKLLLLEVKKRRGAGAYDMRQQMELQQKVLRGDVGKDLGKPYFDRLREEGVLVERPTVAFRRVEETEAGPVVIQADRESVASTSESRESSVSRESDQFDQAEPPSQVRADQSDQAAPPSQVRAEQLAAAQPDAADHHVVQDDRRAVVLSAESQGDLPLDDPSLEDEVRQLLTACFEGGQDAAGAVQHMQEEVKDFNAMFKDIDQRNSVENIGGNCSLAGLASRFQRLSEGQPERYKDIRILIRDECTRFLNQNRSDERVKKSLRNSIGQLTKDHATGWLSSWFKWSS